MRSYLAILVGLLVAGPANAQFTNCMANGPFVNCNSSDGSMTNCNQTGTILNCNTMGGNGSGSNFYDSNQEGGAAGGIVSFIHSIQIKKARSRVNKALKAGDCDTAMREAINSEDMAFASQVRSYCTSRR